MQPLAVLADLDLTRVAGGEGAPATVGDASFGRCGPGAGWKWLGDVYTPQCQAHDAAVRGELAQGTPPWKAHLNALPLLPAAVGSYFRARFGH
jgi:hypothetical protein